MPDHLALRSATLADAAEIASLLRASMSSHSWMPTLYTPEEDQYFVSNVLLPAHEVTVAERADGIVGFVAIREQRIDQLYVRPDCFGQGIGTRLLHAATSEMEVVTLYCFQQNQDARRFYERHGFRAKAVSDGSNNNEGLPDILYIRP